MLGPRCAKACAGDGAELVGLDPTERGEGREPELRRRTSKGNKAHGRIGRGATGNGRGALRTRQRRKASKSSIPKVEATKPGTGNGTWRKRGDRTEATARGQRPQRCGTAAVGWNSSRGVKRVAGNAPALRIGLSRQVGTEARKQETRRTSGSAAGCDKPAPSGRRNPSGWCETTRMERDREVGIFATEACSDACGSGRPTGTSMERR